MELSKLCKLIFRNFFSAKFAVIKTFLVLFCGCFISFVFGSLIISLNLITERIIIIYGIIFCIYLFPWILILCIKNCHISCGGLILTLKFMMIYLVGSFGFIFFTTIIGRTITILSGIRLVPDCQHKKNENSTIACSTKCELDINNGDAIFNCWGTGMIVILMSGFIFIVFLALYSILRELTSSIRRETAELVTENHMIDIKIQ